MLSVVGRRFVQPVMAQSSMIKSIGSVRAMGSVFDKLIHITFVDTEGNRVSVPAKIGQTLYTTALNNKVDLEGPCNGRGNPRWKQHTEKWREYVYGEGAQCFLCHVKISSEYKDILPVMEEEDMQEMRQWWDEECTSSSYLACQVKLDKRHDGMVVFVPDAPVVSLPTHRMKHMPEEKW